MPKLVSLLASLTLVVNARASMLAVNNDKCTAIASGPAASKMGGSMTTQTVDCADCDWRVNKVPAKDWPEGSVRPVWQITGQYPRQVREDRGETWSVENLDDAPQRKAWAAQKDKWVIGHIPQVKHTFALIEGAYGIMNEHQVAMGESTCAAKLWAAPVSDGGHALLELSELSQLGLERGRTAREAIQIMGDLAEQYGYYSAEWSVKKYAKFGDKATAFVMGEGGEALTVVDPKEAWVFHILPDDTGRGAIWVAQRIPDNHITIIANTFRIREIDPNDKDTFMMSKNVFEVAQRKGWWDPAMGPLDFLKTYSPSRYHPRYSNRRVWRVLSLSAPSLQLPAETNEWGDDYPFSVAVEKPLIPEDLMRYQRDHFEGTPYSTTTGLPGGPYGDPNRWDLAFTEMPIDVAMAGEYERTISLFRTSYSFVATARQHVPRELALLWLSQYAPDMSSFTPMYIQAEKLPKAFITGNMHSYNPDSAWWSFSVAGNWASRFYSHAIVEVRKVQMSIESQLSRESAMVEERVMQLIAGKGAEGARGEVRELLSDFTSSRGQLINRKWKDLFLFLVPSFRDGYHVTGLEQESVTPTSMFYPKWWLEATGYFTDTFRNDMPGHIVFGANPLTGQSSTFSIQLLLGALLIFTAGWASAKYSRAGVLGSNREQYTELSSI